MLRELLGTSDATVRRDLEWLESRQILERTHGGAILSRRMQLEPAYHSSASTHPLEKEAIGAAAAALIEEGDSVFVNSGTTATQVIRHVRSSANITVVTNNVIAALETAGAAFKLILVGGAFRSSANSVAGHFATQTLRQVSASKAFIGVDGISLKYGCTTPIGAEAEIARLMIERTQGAVVVVADHGKWGVVSNFEIAPIERVDVLITDEGLDAGAREELLARAVDVRLARVERSGDGQVS